MKMALRISAIAIAALAPTATALELTLGFNTLPSAQGWTYSATGPTHGGQIETNIWNANGLRLAMNTIGSGGVSPSSNLYIQLGMLNTIDPIVVEVTSRMLQHEINSHYGWCFGFETGAQGVAVGFETDSIALGTGTPIAFDATGFHDYRIEFTPGAASFSLFVDDTFFASGSPSASANNRIYFGDGSGASNGRAEMTAYSFTQVPEPTSATMLLAGLAALAALRRKNPLAPRSASQF